MTKAEQKQKISEFIIRGEEIGKKENNSSSYIPHVGGPLFEAWINEINIFNERNLKEHPLYSDIYSTCLHHKSQITSHKFMMGHLLALVNDTDYWEENHEGENSKIHTVLPINKGTERHMNPIIFISHRSIDVEIADMLKDYFVMTGIPNDYIFCSSLPGNDVSSVISREVKEKLSNSSVNIAILSNSYYESAYCTNEAGIIWLQDPDVPAVVIGLPEIDYNNMHGFLNSDYKLRRLDNLNDISAICDVVCGEVGITPKNFSIVTAANQKLMAHYVEYLSSRTMSEVSSTLSESLFDINDDVTTDDEKVVLYYILTEKVRRVQKAEVYKWLTQNEIYNINVENALDLLSSLGTGTYEEETLNMDIEIFRKYMANADDLILLLTSTLEKYQSLSSERFVKFWESGRFSEEDKLFIAYLVKSRMSTLGARWMADNQIKSIHQWELNNLLDGSVSSTYDSHLNQFIENKFVYESGWTEYGNAREYTLCNSLKELLFSSDFQYIFDLEAIMDAHKDYIPF